MNLKERLEAAKKALGEVKAGVEAGTKSADDLKNAIAEVNAAQEAYDAAEQASALLKNLGTNNGEGEVNNNPQAKSLGQHFAEFLKSKQLPDHFHVSAPAFKAASDPILSPAGAVGFATTYDKRLVEAARTQLVVRDLFASENITGSTLVYLVEGAMEGSPDVVAEGAAKPQIHFADPEPKTVSLSKIAAYIKESDEYITDFPFLESAINGRLLYELGLAEQNMIVEDLVGTSGIQSDSTSWTDQTTATALAELILQAIMDVQNASGFAADAVMINPADWFALRTAKTATGEYFGGGFFGAQDVPNIWGVPVCVTTAVAAGSIVVGAYKTCASIVTNGGVSVDAVNTNEDDFNHNLMTIRAEERLALAVRRPAGFKLIEKEA